MHIAFHINPSLRHHAEHAEWFRKGIDGHRLDITTDINQQADIHIVSGPHYAKQRWIDHPNVILIDRAYIPSHQIKTSHVSEDYVSIGWMNSLGGRDFIEGYGKQKPEVGTPTGDKTIFLADYNGIVEQADTVRLHPVQKHYELSLADALQGHKIAVGYNTTALVNAGLAGLTIICKGTTNIMLQPNWLELLPYADWHYTEIQSGQLWDHLLLSQGQRNIR